MSYLKLYSGSQWTVGTHHRWDRWNWGAASHIGCRLWII